MAAMSESESVALFACISEVIEQEQELILLKKNFDDEEELLMNLVNDDTPRHNHHRQKGFFEADISRYINIYLLSSWWRTVKYLYLFVFRYLFVWLYILYNNLFLFFF